jgi:hypothetical protein
VKQFSSSLAFLAVLVSGTAFAATPSHRDGAVIVSRPVSLDGQGPTLPPVLMRVAGSSQSSTHSAPAPRPASGPSFAPGVRAATPTLQPIRMQPSQTNVGQQRPVSQQPSFSGSFGGSSSQNTFHPVGGQTTPAVVGSVPSPTSSRLQLTPTAPSNGVILTPVTPSNSSTISSHATPMQTPAAASTRITLTPIGESRSLVTAPASNSTMSGSTASVTLEQPARVAITPTSSSQSSKGAPVPLASKQIITPSLRPQPLEPIVENSGQKNLAVETVRGLPKATKDVGIGLAEGSAAAAGEIGRGVVGGIKGGANAVAHPVQTAKRASSAIAHPVQTSKSVVAAGKELEASAVEGAKQFGSDINRGDGRAVGRTLGRVYTNVGLAVVGGEAGVASRAATFEKGVVRGVQASRTVETGAARAGVVGNLTRETSAIGDTAKVVQGSRTLTQTSFNSPKAAEAAAASAGNSRDFKTLIQASQYAGGHSERHVAQTSFDLASRLSREPKIQAASTFRSKVEQEAALNRAFDVNSQKIQSWVNRGAKNDLRIDAPFFGGAVLERGATTVKDGSQVRAILRGNGSGGYYLLTAFPRP